MKYNLCFGATLRQIRQNKGLTLRKLAALSEIDSAYISKIETGVKLPSPLSSVIPKILIGLNITNEDSETEQKKLLNALDYSYNITILERLNNIHKEGK